MNKVAVVMMVIFLGGCRPLTPPQPPTLDCGSVAGLMNPRGRMSALMSVHANALGGESHGYLKLQRAALVLECEFQGGLAGGASRKRRVVAELAAYGGLRRFAGAIAVFGADVDKIRAAVEEAHPHKLNYLLRHPDLLEMIVSNMIRNAPPLGGMPAVLPASTIPAADSPEDLTHRRGCQGQVETPAQVSSEPLRVCDWKQEEPYGVWPIGPTITVKAKVSIAAPAGSIHPNVDPQNWDQCSPFFDPPPDATKIEGASVPYPGSDYPWRKMRERFTCTAPECLSWFENRLDVKADTIVIPGTNYKGYVPSYGLPPDGHVAGCVGSLDPNCVGGNWVKIESDWGHLEVYTEDGRASVVSYKEVKFDNDVVTGVTGAIYAYAELARELAELACCKKAFERRE